MTISCTFEGSWSICIAIYVSSNGDIKNKGRLTFPALTGIEPSGNFRYIRKFYADKLLYDIASFIS